MPSAAWAWDMLRENKGYHHDCVKGLKHAPTLVELENGCRLLIGNRRYNKARKWGLLFFVDPDLNAMEADVFWKPSYYPATVHVRLGRPQDDTQTDNRNFGRTSDTVMLQDFCCRRTLFESINGSRHIVLKSRRYWFQLYCDSPHPIDDKALVEFRVDGGLHSNKRMNSMRQIIALHRSRGGKISQIGYRRNTERLQKYLTALRIKSQGGDYRDIAIALEGLEFVKAEWFAGYSPLKQKMYRIYKNAREYRDGKYLSLLE